ncbi:MAG TPA: DMSO reductase, partial [Rubrivivax sp.]|nr:DMSO reductase [Rubrivivax sp.]
SGIRHPKVSQVSMGFMGGSFNTREFLHGRTPGALRQVKWAFMLGAFVLPAGLLAERWYFLAQANHPQNLYYQAVS